MPNFKEPRRLARLMGDGSSITDRFGAPAHFKRRVYTRGIGFSIGRIQMGVGIWGLAGAALLFNWIDNKVKQARSEPLWVGTAIRYGDYLNDGTAHMPATRWWDDGIRNAQKKVESESFMKLFGSVLEPPNLSGGISRTTLYEGAEFWSDIQSIMTGGIVARLFSRASGAASARLFFGTLMSDNNPAMIPALVYQKELMKSINDKGLVDTGCLLNSIAIGKTRQEMLMKSVKGCRLAASVNPATKGDIEAMGDLRTDFTGA